MRYELTTTATFIVTYSVLGPAVNGQFYGVASPIPQATVVTNFGSEQTPPTTATPPGAPTIGTATATGTTTANVSFTAPASNGGAAITTYTATSSPEGITGTLSRAGSGTITVTGLTAGTPYTFTVTATNGVGTSSASGASNSITTWAVPVNTAAPVVSGTATVGQTLSTTNGTWAGVPTPTYTYQWQRDGANISGATSSTYTLVSGDTGSAIRCVVTATNAAGRAAANSNATSSAAADNTPFKPVNTVLPEISGLAVIGNPLTVTAGTWIGNPSSITYTYQWQRLGVDISGATSSTYTLVREDSYYTDNDPPKISCIVTARNTVGSTSAKSRTTIFVIFPRNPSPPRNLQIINTTESPRTVTLAWDPPEDDGWAPITGYYVTWNSNLNDGNNASGYYGASSGYTEGAIAATQLIIPVNDSTTYGYRVRARNAYRISETAVLSQGTGPLGPLLSFTITPSEVNITEGQSVTFNITTKNVAIGTTLYWIVTPGASSSEQSDFVENTAGGLVYQGQPLSITLTGKMDGVSWFNEGTETFTLSLYPQPGMPDIYKYLYASATIKISDPPPQYNFRPGTPTSVNEGSSITFNVDTENVADNITLYWDVLNSSTSDADFPDIYGNFSINNNTGSFSVNVKADNSTEGDQQFYIVLRRFGNGIGGLFLAQSDIITINDTSNG